MDLNLKPDKVLQIICVTYGHGEELKCLINSIKTQTINNWFLRIIHDGNCHGYKILKKELEEENYLNEKVTIECTEQRHNDWGHSLRDYALKNQNKKSDWTIITNGDNYYLPTLTETILALSAEKPKADLIYWDFVQRFDKEIHKTARTTYRPLRSQLQIGLIDMGAVAVKTNIATKVGFNSREFAADWVYISECIRKINSENFKNTNLSLNEINNLFAEKVQKIQEILFVHI